MQPEIKNTNAKDNSNGCVKVYVKGSGSTACLCTGTLEDEPQFIQFKHKHISGIEVGGQFMLGIGQVMKEVDDQLGQKSKKEQYHVMAWGNFNGNLIYQPTSLYTLGMENKVKQISCGWNHALILVSGLNNVLGMGQSKYGQLGNHHKSAFYHQFIRIGPDSSQRISMNMNHGKVNNQSKSVHQLREIMVCGAGFRQSYWVDSSNTVYGCGESKNYELGVANKKQLLPATIIHYQHQQQPSIIKIQTGKKFALFLSNQNKVYSIGTYTYSNTLNSTKQHEYSKLTLMRDDVVDIACGWTHALMVDREGKVWAQGRNNFGQLGIGVNKQKQFEQELSRIGEKQQDVEQLDKYEGFAFTQMLQVSISQPCAWVSSGTEFSFACGASGTLYGWGWNEHQNITASKQDHILWSPTKINAPFSMNMSSKAINCKTQPAITVIEVQQQQQQQQKE